MIKNPNNSNKVSPVLMKFFGAPDGLTKCDYAVRSDVSYVFSNGEAGYSLDEMFAIRIDPKYLFGFGYARNSNFDMIKSTSIMFYWISTNTSGRKLEMVLL